MCPQKVHFPRCEALWHPWRRISLQPVRPCELVVTAASALAVKAELHLQHAVGLLKVLPCVASARQGHEHVGSGGFCLRSCGAIASERLLHGLLSRAHVWNAVLLCGEGWWRPPCHLSVRSWLVDAGVLLQPHRICMATPPLGADLHGKVMQAIHNKGTSCRISSPCAVSSASE